MEVCAKPENRTGKMLCSYPERIVHSSHDGEFDFPAIYVWDWVPLAPWDRFYPQLLVAEAPGYERAEKDFGLWGVVTNQMILLKPELK